MDTSSCDNLNSDDFRAIITSSMDGFLLVDMNGNILEVNDSYCQLVGYSREQLLNMHVSGVDAIDRHEDVVKRVEKISRIGSLRFETKHLHKNGSIIDIEVSSNYSPAHGGSIFSFVRDISYHKRSRKIIATRLRLIEYSHKHSLSELLRETLDEAEKLTGSCIGFYHFMDAGTEMLTLQAWSTRTAAEFCKAEGRGSHYPVSQAGVWVDCVHERRPVIHNDYDSLPHRKGMPEGHARVLRELVVPIFRDDNIVAILGVGNKQTDYESQDIEVVTILADLAWEVAERKKAEEALKKSEAILTSSQHLAKVGGWKWNVTQKSMIWTEETYRIHGFEPGTINPGSPEHIEKSLNCYDPEARPIVLEAFQRCIEHGEEYDLELPFTTADGRRLWVRTTAKPIWRESRVAKVIGNIMDITESRQMKDELARQADFNMRVFNSSDSSMAVVDNNGIILGINEAWRTFSLDNMGSDESRWGVGTNYFVKFDAKWGDTENAEEAFSGVRKVQSGELSHFSLEYPCHGEGNVKRWFLLKVLPLKGKEGSVLCMHTNITEQKMSELALSESEEQFSNSFHYAPIGIALVSPDGCWLKVNQAVCDMIGYTEEELLALTFQEITHPDDLEADLAQVRQMLAGEISTYQMEKRYFHKNGDIVWALLSVSLVRNQKRDPKHFISQIIDITANKTAEEKKQKLEAQYQQTQKLESLGILAGGIAHDFNNILAIIVGYCHLIKIDHKSAERNIPQIEKAAERAAELCRQMLAYAGKSQFVQKHINIADLVDEMVNMLKATINQNAVIRLHLSDDLLMINADESQIRQIVMNLIINASEAIENQQGEIHVSLNKKIITEALQEKDYLGLEITPGCYACLEVADTGCGMSEETQQHIFEPFYTTKFTGRGLGMSAVLGIIKSHNGALQFFSQSGKGSTFKILLPVESDDVFEVKPHAATLPPTWHGSGTVLLVEDEEQLLDIASDMLTMLGFSVIATSNGREAMEQYQKHSADINIVVTDIGMPVMDGYVLFRELKRVDPLLPIIVSSGFGDKIVTSQIPSEEIAGLVSKPYRFEQFRDVLKGVMKERGKTA